MAAHFTAADPKPPRIEGGPWLSVVTDGHGDDWPTGAIHPSEADARLYASKIADDWNSRQAKRPWWKVWHR